MPRSELRKGEPIPVGIDKEFQRAYATTPNVLLAARYGVSVVTILKWARRVRLRKDPDYRRAVQRSNASKRRLTLEQREHLSQRARGRRVSPETIAKALETKRRRGTILSGSRHPFWKGGRPWERFRDPTYVRWRNAVLARDEYRCRHCGRQCRKHEKGLAAHHIRSYASEPDLRFDLDNGLTLCRRCHMDLHGRSLRPVALIPCACGCGTQIPERDVYGRARRYVNHHARRRATS
jgi:5-methylcytosine-specific restriction endonuclease McrA